MAHDPTTAERSFRAVHRGAPMSPRKARLVVDLIRGKQVNDALDVLRHSSKRAAPLLTKVLMSALANAQLDEGVDHNRLHVVDVRADAASTLKRYKVRARGQMFPLITRHCHLTVVLAERDAKVRRRQRGGADRSRRARVEASRRAQGAEPGADAAPGAAE